MQRTQERSRRPGRTVHDRPCRRHTGFRREAHIATFAPSVSAGGAAFLDSQHVLWVAVEDHSQGDAGMFSLSLHVTNAASDVVLARSPRSNVNWPTIAVSPAGFVAVPGAGLIASDGTVLVSNFDSTDILRLTADGNAVIALSVAGEVSLVGIDGATTHLASAGSTSGAGLINPFAAYTP